MGQPATTTAQALENLAARVHSLAFDFAEERRGHRVSDRLIAEVEQASADLHATVRGR